jgi:hypothetical protein
MSTQERKTRGSDLGAGMDAPPPESAVRVQFKRDLAGLSAAQQVEALKPPAPMVVQQKAAGSSSGGAVQFQGGDSDSAPTAISDSGATVSTEGGSVSVVSGGAVSIVAPVISLDAPMVNAAGILSASVLQADTVIGASYTPGAGNVM